MWPNKAKASVAILALTNCLTATLFVSEADARRQLVPDLPSVEVHLEVLQSLAATPPNYASSGYGAATSSAVPFAQSSAPVQRAQQPVVRAPSLPTPRSTALPQRQVPVQQPIAQPVQAFTPPEISQALQQPKTTAPPFTRRTQPTTVAAPAAVAAKPAPTPKLPTRPIRSVAEGYKSAFATYEPASEPAAVQAPKRAQPIRTAPKVMAAKPKPAAAPAVKAPPKLEAPAPKVMAAKPKPVSAPVVNVPAPKAQPAPVPMPSVTAKASAVAPVAAPEMPALPEPNLANMVFEPFQNEAPKPAALPEVTPPTVPAPLPTPQALPELPTPAMPAQQTATLSAEPIAPLPQPVEQLPAFEGLPALPDLGSLTDEPEVNVTMPTFAQAPEPAPMPAMPDLPPITAPVAALPDLPPVTAPAPIVEPAPMPEVTVPRTPQIPSNLPSLAAIIGEADPTDGIIAEPLPELPSELPSLPSEPMVVAKAVVEPLPEIVMPEPIVQELPVLEAPKEFELAALPAPPPSVAAPAPSVPNPATIGSTALTLNYPTEETRLPDDKKAELERIAQQIISSGSSARIVGYAGGPPEQSSLTRRVSLARVLDVRAHLINYGVPANKVTPQSLGNKGAGTSNPDRVEIILQ